MNRLPTCLLQARMPDPSQSQVAGQAERGVLKGTYVFEITGLSGAAPMNLWACWGSVKNRNIDSLEACSPAGQDIHPWPGNPLQFVSWSHLLVSHTCMADFLSVPAHGTEQMPET